jgi:hypothetical protein
MKKPRKKGRPTRAEASAKALKALIAAGVDPMSVDPERILASIAIDAAAPASARVSACRELLRGGVAKAKDAAEGVEATPQADALSARALALLSRVGRAAN